MSTMNAQHEYRLSRRRSMSYYPRNRKPKIFPGKGPAKKFIMMVFFGLNFEYTCTIAVVNMKHFVRDRGIAPLSARLSRR